MKLNNIIFSDIVRSGTCSTSGKHRNVDISCTYQGETVLCNERARPGTRAKLSCKQSYNLPPTDDDPVYREIVRLDDALWDRRLFSCLSGNLPSRQRYRSVYLWKRYINPNKVLSRNIPVLILSNSFSNVERVYIYTHTHIHLGDTFIVYGFDGKLCHFPWHAVIYQSKANNSFGQICCETLICNSLVMSGNYSICNK